MTAFRYSDPSFSLFTDATFHCAVRQRGSTSGTFFGIASFDANLSQQLGRFLVKRTYIAV
jgi:hypothetical protein